MKLPLILSVARNIPIDRGGNYINSEIVKKVHYRDKNTCLFCGWVEQKTSLLSVSSLTCNYDLNTLLKHSVTSCVICQLTQRLGMAANLSAGDLIYLPELTQPQVNELARALFLAKKLKIKDCDDAIEPLISYIHDERKVLASQYIGPVPFKLNNFAVALRELENELYLKRESMFSPLRFWPKFNYLEEVVQSNWDNHLSNFPQSGWIDLASQIETN